MIRGPGVTAEATHWLYDQGVRVMGIDAWGWDAPLNVQAEEAPQGEESEASSGPRTRRTFPYCQIERLANLGELPATGFEVACFPLTGSWARAPRRLASSRWSPSAFRDACAVPTLEPSPCSTRCRPT